MKFRTIEKMLEASSIDAQSHLHELPVKSGFEQVHVASTASEPNLVGSPFSDNFQARSTVGLGVGVPC